MQSISSSTPLVSSNFIPFKQLPYQVPPAHTHNMPACHSFALPFTFFTVTDISFRRLSGAIYTSIDIFSIIPAPFIKCIIPILTFDKGLYLENNSENSLTCWLYFPLYQVVTASSMGIDFDEHTIALVLHTTPLGYFPVKIF